MSDFALGFGIVCTAVSVIVSIELGIAWMLGLLP